MTAGRITDEDVNGHLLRIITDSEYLDLLSPPISRLRDAKQHLADDLGISLQTVYRTLGFLPKFCGAVSADVALQDMRSDPLVAEYARSAVEAVNHELAETMADQHRQTLALIAALAIRTYAVWTPTIIASGPGTGTYEEAKSLCFDPQWTSWYEAREFRPVWIQHARRGHHLRSPLEQFLIWWRLVTDRSSGWESRWADERQCDCGKTATDYLVGERTAQLDKAWERMRKGEVMIDDGFLTDPTVNRNAVSPADFQGSDAPAGEAWLCSNIPRRFQTIRMLQGIWYFSTRAFPERFHRRLANAFGRIMDIPYKGRVVRPPGS